MFTFNFDDGESHIIKNGSLLHAVLQDGCMFINEEGKHSYTVSNGCRYYTMIGTVNDNGDIELEEFSENPEGHEGEHIVETLQRLTEDDEEVDETFAQIIHGNFGKKS
jgi:hypothetical protein